MTEPCLLTTTRICLRRATPEDAAFIHSLWTSPQVMHFVGFPKGLAITVEEVRDQILAGPDSDFGWRLMAERLDTGDRIGQCKIGIPDSEGICEPDIKLLPDHWGHGYGRELWAAMVDYAFLRSAARIVQGTPNRANIASIKMQLGSRMAQVGEGVSANHPSPHPGAISVPYYKLQIMRNQWLAQRQKTAHHTCEGERHER